MSKANPTIPIDTFRAVLDAEEIAREVVARSYAEQDAAVPSKRILESKQPRIEPDRRTTWLTHVYRQLVTWGFHA